MVRSSLSDAQAGAAVGVELYRKGRLTGVEAARIRCGRMLGDWNTLSTRDRRYWIQAGQRVLESLSQELPIYNLKRTEKVNGKRHVARVWYWLGREPAELLERDLELAEDGD